MKGEITLGRLSIAIVLTTIIDAIVLAATGNGIMSIVLIPLLMFFLVYLLCRKKVSTWLKVVLALLGILAIALCIRFGKIEKAQLQQDVDTNTSVTTQDNQEKKDDEETTNEETEGQEDENAEGEEGCHCGCPYCCRR